MREINLLPPPRRASLRREAIVAALTRFLNGVMAGLIILSIGGVVAGVAMWLLAYLVPSATEATLATEVAVYQRVRDDVGTTNFFLEQIDRVDQERLVWSAFVAQLLAATPPGIQIRSVNGTAAAAPDGTTTRLLTINGQAQARGTLTLFQDRLRVLPGVDAVEAPNSNFLQRENPTFTFQVTLQ